MSAINPQFTTEKYSLEGINNHETIKNEEVKKLENQAPLQSSTTDSTKKAQALTDIIISSGKNLNQIVLENNAPRREEIGKDDNVTNKNVNALGTQSSIGTIANENAMPSEIQMKNDIEK